MRHFYESIIGDGVMDLSEESAKHIVRVLRMQVGDQFVLTDGNGVKATAQIISTDKKSCTVDIIDRTELNNENGKIVLAISFTKNSARMEWLLEKITEIGVTEIIPLLSKRSERSKIKKERFDKILVSAMLQSQQYHLPILHEPTSFEEVIKIEAGNKFIAHCENDTEKKHLNLYCHPEPVEGQLILIGPEGDFTTEEIEQASQQNFKSVSLGNNRLRTETAGLVAVTLLQHAKA